MAVLQGEQLHQAAGLLLLVSLVRVEQVEYSQAAVIAFQLHKGRFNLGWNPNQHHSLAPLVQGVIGMIIFEVSSFSQLAQREEEVSSENQESSKFGNNLFPFY